MTSNKIAVAVPVWNRVELLKQCLAGILGDPRVGEIVIVDDASEADYYEDLETWVCKQNRPIKLIRNPVQLDCYHNKAQAVLHCRLDRVILFDSDNILLPSYLDVLYQQIEEWNPKVVYCPTYAQPHFDYRKFNGVTVDRTTVHHYVEDQTFLTALNTANYFVPRQGYLHCYDEGVDPHTADSMFMALRFLEEGFKLAFVEGLHYFHRVHDGSHYKLNVHKTGAFADVVEARLKALK